MNAHQSGAIKKYLNTSKNENQFESNVRRKKNEENFSVYRFKIEFYACGLTSVAGDLILLGIERFNTTVRSKRKTPITIRSFSFFRRAVPIRRWRFWVKTKRNTLKKLTIRFICKTNAKQIRLNFIWVRKRKGIVFRFVHWFCSFSEYLPDENSFFILSPYEIMKAERRDFDDHVDFLISKKKFQEAIQVFEKPNRRDAVAQRHTQKVRKKNHVKTDRWIRNVSFQSVYGEFVKFLMQNDQIDRAVTFFERIYTTQNEWEEQIRTFIRLNKLDVRQNFDRFSSIFILFFSSSFRTFQPKNSNWVRRFTN